MENIKTNWNNIFKISVISFSCDTIFFVQSVPEIVHFYNQKKFRIYKNLSTIKGSICRSK